MRGDDRQAEGSLAFDFTEEKVTRWGLLLRLHHKTFQSGHIGATLEGAPGCVVGEVWHLAQPAQEAPDIGTWLCDAYSSPNRAEPSWPGFTDWQDTRGRGQETESPPGSGAE